MIRKLTQDDVTPAYVSWLNDPVVTRYMECRWRTHSLQSERLALASDPHYFGIFAPEHIGNINYNPHHFHPIASIGIMIGDKSKWGMGHGTQALQQFCEMLFSSGFRKLWASAYKANLASVNLFLKCGFEIEGTMKAHYMLDGKMSDVVMMGRT